VSEVKPQTRLYPVNEQQNCGIFVTAI